MKLTYNPRRNIGYMRFHEKTAEVETIQVSDSLNVDIAPDGTIYGIELLNANQQLGGDNGGHFVIVNEAAGKTEDIALERSEEHTSELQSHSDLVCRLLLEKKKKTNSK